MRPIRFPCLTTLMTAAAVVTTLILTTLNGVSSVTDDEPKFSRDIYTAAFQEHFPFQNETIRQQVAVSPVISLRSTAPVTYRLVDGDRTLFAIDEADATLYLLRQVDRESLVSDLLTLVVEAVSSSNTTHITRTQILVRIVDVNDNAPRFQKLYHNLSFSDETPNGFRLVQIVAVDPDLGDNAKFSYQLEDNSGALQVDSTSGWLTVADQQKLNHNRQSKLTVYVAVVEQEPSLETRLGVSSGRVRVDIHFDPIIAKSPEEDQPSFVKEQYRFRIGTSTTVESDLGLVAATGFTGGNSVRYAIKSGRTDADTNPTFPKKALVTIDPHSGVVRVAEGTALIPGHYEYIVTASDDRRTASADLLLDVVDVSKSEIDRFVPAAGVVVLERSHDRLELDDQSIVVCADGVCSSPPSALDDTDGDMPPPGRSVWTYRRIVGWIRTTLELDGLASQRDIEDAFQTLFPESFFLIQVPRNTSFNESLGVFSNSHRTNESTPVVFTLLDSDGAAKRYLQLDAKTGTLRTVRDLSEAPVEFSFSVNLVSNDRLLPSSAKKVTIQLVDPFQRRRPVFKQSFYQLSLKEGSYHGSPLARIEVRDFHSAETGRITYELLENERHRERLPFFIDTDTGWLKVDGIVDREEVAAYRLTVQVVDHGLPVLRNRVRVHVTVQDVNDNAPVFSSTNNGSLYEISVLHGTPAGTQLTRAEATDDDATGSNVTYHLASGADFFRIDSTDGWLYNLADMDFDRANSYEVLVVATDDGAPPLSATATVRVIVEDLPCVPWQPLFDKHEFNVTIMENVAVPHAIINLSAWYQVHDYRYRLSLNLTTAADSNAPFALDQTEPVVWLVQPVDRELVSRYLLTLTVQTRSDRRPHYCTQGTEEINVNLNVVDVNDNAPIFENGDHPLILAVSSDTAVGHPVTTLRASDADQGINAAIKYLLTPNLVLNGRPLASKYFDVYPRTGQVVVTAPLHPLAGRRVHYTARAIDRGGSANSKATQLRVTVHVVDTSQNAVLLVLDADAERVGLHRENISSTVGAITGRNVRILRIGPHQNAHATDPERTDVWLYAIDDEKDNLMEAEDLMKEMGQSRQQLNSRFSDYPIIDIRAEVTNLQQSTMRMDTMHVTLVAIGASVLVGALIAIICIILSRKRRSRSTMVVPPLPSPIDYRLERVSKPMMVPSPTAFLSAHPPPVTIPTWSIPRGVLRGSHASANLSGKVQRLPLCRGCGKLMSQPTESGEAVGASASRCPHHGQSQHQQAGRKYPQRMSPQLLLDEQDEASPPQSGGLSRKHGRLPNYTQHLASDTLSTASSSKSSSLETSRDSQEEALYRL